jgi:hypothetical protein
LYPGDKYFENSPPICSYLPKKELLFKMMRACIGCDKIEDLWIFKPKIFSSAIIFLIDLT